MRWTWLRHAMLLAVAAGAVAVEGDTWIPRRRPSTSAQMTRACNSLWEAGAIYPVKGRAEVTESGRLLLVRWADRHPEVGA